MNLRKYVLLAVLAGAGLLHAQPPAPKLELKPGDHIALIGSVAPDRFQHSGWLETLIHARYPQHNLVVRDLAAPGDEVVTRHRSENFGTPDDWLKRVQADVIFAFFGSAESVKGREGVAKYKADLEKWIKDTQAKDYSGKGAPRIVLFSPVAQERHQDPNYPDPSAANERLREYTAATAEVAKANGV
ncbi:MAG TPA: dehydrogenase, partial [Verrucomicrobiae bacterium]|nr:dehydrogenase [Verrucomicrobiae bacterium]